MWYYIIFSKFMPEVYDVILDKKIAYESKFMAFNYCTTITKLHYHNYVVVHFEICRLRKLNSQSSENVARDT